MWRTHWELFRDLPSSLNVGSAFVHVEFAQKLFRIQSELIQNSGGTHSDHMQNSFRIHAEVIKNSFKTYATIIQMSYRTNS